MKDVTISVRTMQRDMDGEEETVELITKGTYEQNDDVHIFRYDESELTGLDGTTTIIELHPDSLFLIRTGSLIQHQEFEVGKTNESVYQTPFGALKLAMHTHELKQNIKQGSGDILLRYDVILEGIQSNYNELSIQAREEQPHGYTKPTN